MQQVSLGQTVTDGTDMAISTFYQPLILSLEGVGDAAEGEATAFTDSIQFLDPTITTMLGIFSVVIFILVAVKVGTDQTDEAIQKILIEFEDIMIQEYPQRWQKEIRPELVNLQGFDRQQKLMQLMEGLQQTDPQFMNRVQRKLKENSTTDNNNNNNNKSDSSERN